MVNKLRAYMNGHLVGDLVRVPSGALRFEYANEWKNSAIARPISLSIPLRVPLGDSEQVRVFFQNLLPDSPRILEHIQKRLGIASSHPFDILAVIGGDCVGALQLLPEGVPPGSGWPEADPLTDEEVERILSNTAKFPLGMEKDGNFRISLAGAQEKTALLKLKGCWMRPRGATPTSHILKLPIGVLSQNSLDLSTSCENEWLCLRIAEAYGFDCAKAEISQFGSCKALAVERFDRKMLPDGRILRLPTEDLCQALGVSPELKYESEGGPGVADVLGLLRYSAEPSDSMTFFKAQVLFWILGATDGHAKNFSIFLDADGYRLTPLYDILTIWPLVATRGIELNKAKLAMAIAGNNRHYKITEIRKRHFLAMASANGLRADEVKREIEAMAEATPSVTAQVSAELPPGFPESVSGPVFETMRKQAQKLLAD